jgi:hypothetical protein
MISDASKFIWNLVLCRSKLAEESVVLVGRCPFNMGLRPMLMRKDLRSSGKAEGLAIISVGRSPTLRRNDGWFWKQPPRPAGTPPKERNRPPPTPSQGGGVMSNPSTALGAGSARHSELVETSADTQPAESGHATVPPGGREMHNRRLRYRLSAVNAISLIYCLEGSTTWLLIQPFRLSGRHVSGYRRSLTLRL